MLTNKKGFTSIYCLFILVLFSMILLTASFVRFAFESKSDFRYFCYQNLKDTQKLLVDGETALLQLNPIARSIRIRLNFLYISLAAAVASENVLLAIEIQKQIQATKQQQRALDIRQKALIRSAELFARAKLEFSLLTLRQKQIQSSRAWSAILQISESINSNTRSPHMFVHPDVAGDTAPVYYLDPDFETLQMFSALWSIWFFARSSFQGLISTNQNWSFECVARPIQKINSLSVQIKADRL